MMGSPSIRIGDIASCASANPSQLYDFSGWPILHGRRALPCSRPRSWRPLVAVLHLPGPGIFAQARVGRYERPFRIFKFRTMFVEDEHNLSQAKSGDPRITPLGRILRRTRLDELPQLVNIIRGEMSFIGPRPLIAKEVDAFQRRCPASGALRFRGCRESPGAATTLQGQ
jgi:hypothetical protein